MSVDQFHSIMFELQALRKENRELRKILVIAENLLPFCHEKDKKLIYRERLDTIKKSLHEVKS